jgi:hypothetical protein
MLDTTASTGAGDDPALRVLHEFSLRRLHF